MNYASSNAFDEYLSKKKSSKMDDYEEHGNVSLSDWLQLMDPRASWNGFSTIQE